MKLNPKLDVFGPDVVCWERGQHGGRTRPMNRDVLFRNLVQLHEVLDRHGIKHWLSHGTMLGAYREGNFIEWDDDADLGLDFSQRGQIGPALEELRRLGFYVPPSDPSKPISKENSPYYDMVAIKQGEKIEGWFFEKKGEHYIYDQPRCGDVLKFVASFFDELDEIDFRGVTFKVPHEPERYLELMYGEKWMIPNKNKKYNHQG
jgi:lipopolysaccharide cholinephosphotransferase